MNIILLGAPGSGKGTQAKLLSLKLSIPHISTGDILRQAVASESSLGLTVKQKIADGELVSDDLVLSLVTERLQNPDCKTGFILDGIPRTLIQAQALERANIKIHCAVNIDVPDILIIERITNRWIHPGSGRVYNFSTNPPKISGRDDLTGEVIVQRVDDTKEVVQKRLEIYHSETKPLTKWYAEKENAEVLYIHIIGVGPVESVHEKILTAIHSLR